MIQDALSVMSTAVSIIEQHTGINPVALGTTQQDVGKAVTEYAIAGTNDVLKNVVKQMNLLKSRIAYSVCLRMQYVAKKGGKVADYYKQIVGDTRWETIKEAEGHDIKYGIKTHVRPTKDELQSLYQMIDLSLKNGRDGKPGITEADAIRFRNMAMTGTSLKRVAQLLGFAKEKAEREAEQKAMRMAQMSMQQNAQAAQISAQEKQMELYLKGQNDVLTYKTKGLADVVATAYKNGEIDFQTAMALLSGQQPQQQPQQQGQQPQGQEQQVPERQAPTEIPSGTEGV